VKVSVALFTAAEEMDARRHSWSRAPRVSLLPEQLVLLGYQGTTLVLEQAGRPVPTPLMAGPDPNAEPDQQLKPDADTLSIPDELAWMFDFERALAVGMAFRVDLTQDQATRGFDRLLVLGVRVGASAQEGRRSLEGLLEGHLRSSVGLEILPQGTPTNNTEQAGSGFSAHGDPASGFKAFFKDEPLYTVSSDPLVKRDGQWLADSLGLSHELARKVPNADGRDQERARAMHLALWTGTIGYTMRTMMKPVFAEPDIEATRSFLSRHVLGCGTIPVLRIGPQPYGILPVTAFSRINWLRQNDLPGIVVGHSDLPYLRKLYAILQRIDADWAPLGSRVSHMGATPPGQPAQGSADPHQRLLDVVGLHPSSVEYYPLKIESEAHKFNQLLFVDGSVAVAAMSVEVSTKPQALQLLRDFGYTGTEELDVFKKLYSSSQPRLDGPLIDTPPLSETEKIAPCAGTMNYIEWLLDAARTNIDTLQEETGFDEGKEPRALLYLMLRYALQLSFHLVGAREQVKAGMLPSLAAVTTEPEFVHVKTGVTTSESRYKLLHDPLPGKTGMRVADYISLNLKLLEPELTEQIGALERLADAPTAQLERAFAEHVDCAGYRLDAWKQGLLHWHLERMHLSERQQGGVFLGAFGWLENVRSEQKELTPADLPRDVAAVVNRAGDLPLMRDSKNLGLIHAPSINHATTAAVLRNGYDAHAGAFAVDLSSRRVRLALGILEGIRGGQSIAALLGYRFERHLHDSGSLTVRALVFSLRRKFPLVANKIALGSPHANEAKAQESIAAMNVVDGLKLLAFVETSTVKTYPWGAPDLPAPTDAADGPLIDAAVTHIRDVNDAVADLVLAEGVHQAVSGNFDRAAGTLDAFSKGSYPPDPDVVKTPRTGTKLVLRAAIHLDPDATAPPNATPLAEAEPSLNAWLRDRMPTDTSVGCPVTFTNRLTDAEETIFVSQQDLDLQPIDVVYRLDTSDRAALQFLDNRIIEFVHKTHAVRVDMPIVIAYTTRTPGNVSFFELQALVNSLRMLTVASRPLQPADLVRTNDAHAAEQPAITLPAAPLTTASNELRTVRLPALSAMIAGLPAAPIDAALDAFVTEVSALASYRIPQTGTGFAFEWRMAFYGRLSATLQAVIERFTKNFTDADALLQAYDAAVGLTEEEKLKQLQAIEALVSTSYLDPPPVSSTLYRTEVGAKVTAYQTKLTDLQNIAATRHATVDAFLQALQVEAAVLAPLDRSGLPLTGELDEVERFRNQLSAAGTALVAEVQKRVDTADDLLSTVPLTVDGAQQAAKLLFGEDFQVVSRFYLTEATAADVDAAWTHSKNGALTQYLRDTVGRPFPIDDWLHGTARVREKMAHWENAILLADAFGATAPELRPIQLPHETGAAWLALEIPPPPPPPPGEAPGTLIASDRLLYQAHFANDFDKTKPICGLLVDEWTEVIPQPEETTGVTFHVDRPNSEPPQAWLLALPAVMNGAWSWDELVDAVHDGLGGAKRRAIEPAHIEMTPYSWFLPATFSAYTFPEISISNYLLKNVNVLAAVTLPTS
jgi:hypothetical protein